MTKGLMASILQKLFEVISKPRIEIAKASFSSKISTIEINKSLATKDVDEVKSIFCLISFKVSNIFSWINHYLPIFVDHTTKP